MSTTINDTVEPKDKRPWSACSRASTGGSNWCGANIVAMVLGFVFFWPLGLFMVYWSVTGRHVGELPGILRKLWSRVSGKWQGGLSVSESRSDNSVFERFQQTQNDRIRELREEIKDRSRRFSEFRRTARQRADEEEFNQFMASSPERADG